MGFTFSLGRDCPGLRAAARAAVKDRRPRKQRCLLGTVLDGEHGVEGLKDQQTRPPLLKSNFSASRPPPLSRILYLDRLWQKLWFPFSPGNSIAAMKHRGLTANLSRHRVPLAPI
jgi:hypothetical protein